MSTAVVAMTGAEALDLIASAPEAADKTPEDLRTAASEFDALAAGKDRLVVTDGRGRRGARSKARERDGEKLRLQAQITRKAAYEIEERKCSTVGDATKPGFVRALMRIGGKR